MALQQGINLVVLYHQQGISMAMDSMILLLGQVGLIVKQGTAMSSMEQIARLVQ